MTSRKEQLAALLAKSPDDAFLLFALGMEEVKAGQWDQAVAYFERAIAADAGYVAAHFQMARALEQAKRFEQAKAAYRRGIQAADAKGDRHAASRMQEGLDALARTTGGTNRDA